MAECIAMSCPRLANTDPDNRALSITVPSSQITRDKMGNTWCNYCAKCRELMDYGHDHGWPEVRATSVRGIVTIAYLIPAGHAEWYLSVACGDRDLIETFYSELLAQPRDAA